jgi:F0F1-type ATP synthase epsilon subunit
VGNEWRRKLASEALYSTGNATTRFLSPAKLIMQGDYQGLGLQGKEGFLGVNVGKLKC